MESPLWAVLRTLAFWGELIFALVSAVKNHKWAVAFTVSYASSHFVSMSLTLAAQQKMYLPPALPPGRKS